MKVLFISQFGKGEIREMTAIPSVWHRVNALYSPPPTVTDVIWFPDLSLFVEKYDGVDVDVAVVLS